VPNSRTTAKMLKADLAEATIPYRDDAQRVADFHALRHTFVSNLAAGGVHPKLAQALARHSTITLTMDRYSHTVLGDQAEALDALPDLATETDRQQQKATGTDDHTVLTGSGQDTNAVKAAPINQRGEQARLSSCLSFRSSLPVAQQTAVSTGGGPAAAEHAGASSVRMDSSDSVDHRVSFQDTKGRGGRVAQGGGLENR
jgi:hypothetical protein